MSNEKMYKGFRASLLSMLLPLFVVAEGNVRANAEDVHDIIDICTASEKIMKDYALIGMKITYHNPQKALDETLKHLKQEMKHLEKHKLSKKLHNEELKLHKEWAKMEENLTKTPTKESALALHNRVNTFAEHCEVLAEHLAKDTGNMAEHYVVEIARLNLDVQELAAIYVMKAWGAMGDDAYYEEVKHILHDYIKTYDDLMAADGKMVSSNVKKHLKVLKKHFMIFEFMAESRSGRYVPLLIAKKAEKINKETKNILEEEEREVE